MKHSKSILITAPSGAGKTTLVKKLLADYPQFTFSISCTTRSQRPNETHGVDYFFISQEEFTKRIHQQEFLEWEEVYSGTFYGTLRSEIGRIHLMGNIPVFDIDIMGAMSIKKSLCSEVLSIFIAPPNMDVLEERLRSRKTETEEKIRMRIHKAQSEMKFANFFDKKIVNDNLDSAYQKLRELVDHYLLD